MLPCTFPNFADKDSFMLSLLFKPPEDTKEGFKKKTSDFPILFSPLSFLGEGLKILSRLYLL
jgi:hypothetical protein